MPYMNVIYRMKGHTTGRKKTLRYVELASVELLNGFFENPQVLAL